MTKLIDKTEGFLNLYFTLDRELHGFAMLNVISDFDRTESTIELQSPIITNERYTVYSLPNPFIGYADGLYTYQLVDDFGSLETGSIKIQADDFDQANYTSYQNEDSEYITYDGDDY